MCSSNDRRAARAQACDLARLLKRTPPAALQRFAAWAATRLDRGPIHYASGGRYVRVSGDFLGAMGPGSGGSDCRVRRDGIAAVRPVSPGLPKIAARCRPHAVADRYADMLHDRIIAVAIDHAGSAAVTYTLSSVKVADVAERPVPVVAAPELQVPIQIEGFPACETPEHLRLAA